MQRGQAQDEPRPNMDGFGSKLKSSIERYVAFFLALALLGALWSTALGRLSEQSTAETLLTRAGTDIINPLLTANNSGIGDAFYQQLQGTAKAHPNDALPIGFLKLSVPGKAIAGKNFTEGSRVIYAAVADAYYRLGPNGVFALPSQLQQVVNGYTPFVQQATNGVKTPLPNLPIPQLPAFASQLYTSVGITPTTLTAEGHATSISHSLWLWLASGVLALLLVLMNRGWDRLWSIAWPLFHSSWHIALFGLIATVLVNVRAAQAQPYLPILTLISGTFMTVFYVAAALGIALVIVSLVGNRMAKAREQAPRRDAALAGGVPNARAYPTATPDDAATFPPPTYRPSAAPNGDASTYQPAPYQPTSDQPAPYQPYPSREPGYPPPSLPDNPYNPAGPASDAPSPYSDVPPRR